MNFLTIKTSWANVEFIPFKLSIVTAGIFIGAYFHDFFRHYDALILTVFFITVVWTIYLWVSKMKESQV
ncbi:MAG: hypothetical protein DA408_19445 [Bacteroidetes bacterium]|nr:MAG: hypothetical protein C7N36_15035 [Bacteroidota bacterium]PTM08956.1 MAG: hypothetical protein DA408_19445 [Bacteroidota bacterium]